MVKRSKGIRSKSRHILRKKTRERGLSPITRSLREFKEGEYVHIVLDPSIQKGMPHIRFHGYTGKIKGKQGEAYLVGIRDGGKQKTLIVRPEHLRRG
ncbi:MAG: 50S ribosomal protein L21e [Thermoplasmata archaeon]|nr:MAG: 50S ribosomal protein L21e [Thermoplasmata archaeon]